MVWLGSQWLKHQADSQGISVEEALQQAERTYAQAQDENDALKKLGHQ